MIFLDSSNIDIIKRYYSMNIIRGVTTNPTILKKDGIKDIDTTIKQIAKIIEPFPLSVEVTSDKREDIISQAKYYSELSYNINIKIPIHSQDGDSYLEIIKDLSNYGIDINATAMMSAQQGILASLAGAKYLSLFCGRINDMGYDSHKEIARLRRLIDRFDLDSLIIAASSRETYNIVEWLDAGADIVTVSPDILDKMIVNPRSKETVKQFLEDAR